MKMVFQFLLSKGFYAFMLLTHLNLLRLMYPEMQLQSANLGGNNMLYKFSTNPDAESAKNDHPDTANLLDKNTIITDSFGYTCFPTIHPDITSLNFKSYWHLSRSALFINRSCAVLDFASSTVWLLGDTFGAHPIFYSFSHHDYCSKTNAELSDSISSDSKTICEDNYVVTSDYLLALRLGYYDINSVSPGGIVAFDSKTREIKYISDRRTLLDNVHADLYGKYGRYGKREFPHGFNSIKHASYKLVTSLTNSILGNSKYKYLSSAQRRNVNVTVEIDSTDPSSGILNCIVASIGFSRQMIFASPAAGFYGKGMDSFPLAFLQAHTHGEAENNIFDLEDRMHTQIRRPSLRSIALERWKICQLAKESSSHIIHFNSGLFDRSVKNYFQNLFCEYFGVEIHYVFGVEALSRVTDLLEFPRSNLMSALQLLFADEVCPANISYPNTINSELIFVNQISRKEVISVDGNGRLESHNNNVYINADHSYISHQDSLANPLFTLLDVATRFQSEDFYIFVVMVTSDYIDMFLNFLCSLSQPKVKATNLLVITPHDDVVRVAATFNVGYFKYISNDSESKGSSFGTLQYQELMLYRTKIAMDLLHLGFNVIIADIDTVWNENPLDILRDAEHGIGGNDIAVTNDYGEICGCFVVLTTSKRSIHFWETILDHHAGIVEEGKKNSGILVKFTDSEQKLLTHFLTNGEYKHEIAIKLLSSAFFPSGYEYFNLRNASSPPDLMPTIIHNNFIVSKSAKIYRFQRHGFWRVIDGWESILENTLSKDICVGNSVPKPNFWKDLTIMPVFNTTIPSLQCVLPLHGETVNGSSKLVSVLTENSHAEYSSGALWADSLGGVPFFKMMIIDLKFTVDNLVLGFTMSLDGTNIECSADVGVNRTVFAFDRNGNYEYEAIAQAKVSKYALKFLNLKNTFFQARYQSFMAPLFQSSPSDKYSNAVVYHIKILAYKRPDSLRRLLASLLTAEFLNQTINLEFCIDGPKVGSSLSDMIKIAEVRSISNEFKWPFGDKLISIQAVNRGLKEQWFYAWQPEKDNEVAFIFEDDVEVSPLFFGWATKAVQKYYVEDEGQRYMHKRILDAVREDIKLNLAQTDEGSRLDKILYEFSGEPLIYGICLQKQHLDPLHYPKRLDIRTGNKPYLFSLVGSWGPLMFPMLWQAFREWWSWQQDRKGSDPLLENIIINYFYEKNHDIWTPWFSRFSHSIGSKCFYSNLPGNYSLVVNHRESGDNYAVTSGKVHELIPPWHVDLIKNVLPEITDDLSFDRLYEVINPSLRDSILTVEALERLEFVFSICNFPSAQELASSQFDFAIRRVGSYFVRSTLNNPYDIESFYRYNDKNRLLDWETMITYIKDSADLSSTSEVYGLGKEFWVGAADVIEKAIPHFAIVIHADITPLLPLLLLKFDRHHLLTSNGGIAAVNSCFSDTKFDGIDKNKLAWQYINHSITTDSLKCNSLEELSSISNHKFSFLVLETERIVSGLKVPFAHNLLFIGPCASSPSSFSLRGRPSVERGGDLVLEFGSSGDDVFRRGHNNSNSNSNSNNHTSYARDSNLGNRFDFYRIESLCLEVSNGWGLTIYRTQSVLSQTWIDSRHAISRRLVNSLVSERFVELRKQALFV